MTMTTSTVTTHDDNFRQILEGLQSDLGLKNAEFAVELGIGVGQLYRWRRGEARPTIARATALAKKFGMTTSDFLGLR